MLLIENQCVKSSFDYNIRGVAGLLIKLNCNLCCFIKYSNKINEHKTDFN